MNYCDFIFSELGGINVFFIGEFFSPIFNLKNMILTYIERIFHGRKKTQFFQILYVAKFG
jgi:hypothetical protein